MANQTSGIAVVCELNPLHSGHKYLMDFAKTQSENLLLIMSGNFCQRGEISVLDKFSKAQLALQNGADVVVELPTAFATASAKDFATYSIKTLKNAKFVDKLCFGSECGDIKLLCEVAKMQLAEEKSFANNLKSMLKEGLSFATASNKSMQLLLQSKGIKDDFLKSNNILAMEYIKAIYVQNCDIEPITIRREDNFCDNNLQGEFASASAIRQNLCDKSVERFLPQNVIECLQENKQNMPDYQKYYFILQSRILSQKGIENICGATEGIENLFKKNIGCTTFEEFVEKCTTKRYNRAKIMRLIFSIVAEIDKNLTKKALNFPQTYCRILKIKKKELLSQISNAIISMSDIKKLDSPILQELLQKDILATRLHSIICSKPTLFNADYKFCNE